MAEVKKVDKRRKLVWKIDFTKKKNKARFVWFCILGGLAVILLLQALIYVIIGIWKDTASFLIFFPTICLVIDFFIGRRILLSSQPE